jgi:hypothetical protein
MSIVRLGPDALSEIDDTYHWYEALRLGLGLEFLEAVEDALEILRAGEVSLSLWPGISSRFKARRALLQRFPFGLAYTTQADGTIRVWALAHLKRRPGYWLKRLPSKPRPKRR